MILDYELPCYNYYESLVVIGLAVLLGQTQDLEIIGSSGNGLWSGVQYGKMTEELIIREIRNVEAIQIHG